MKLYAAKTFFFASVICISLQTTRAATKQEEARFLGAAEAAFAKHDADAFSALACWERVAVNGKADAKQEYTRYVAENVMEMVLANPDQKEASLAEQKSKTVAYCLNLPVLKELKIKFRPGHRFNNATFPVGEKDGKLWLLQPAIVEGLMVTGTMKQIIGIFPSYGQVGVGDMFELNLTHLAKDMIEFTRPHFDPNKQTRPYIPFSPPLVLEKATPSSSGYGTIRLSATDTTGVRSKLVILIYAREFRKDSNALIRIYEESSGDVPCMAEAEGVLK
jgi:hypothetical protein